MNTTTSAIIRAAQGAYESARDAHNEAMPEAVLAYEFYRCFAGDADDAPEYDPELPEVMPEEFRREYERMCVESEVIGAEDCRGVSVVTACAKVAEVAN